MKAIAILAGADPRIRRNLKPKWNVTKDRVDQLMYVSPAANREWQPKHFMDLRYGWDERYVKKYAQPFSAFYFAKNTSAVLGSSRAARAPVLKKMAAYLDFIASQSIDRRRGHLLVVNNFEFPMMWIRLQPGFLGAFQNAYTALGYIHLHEATGERVYLLKARALLDAVISYRQVPLSRRDENGDFWLYEYVFQTRDEDRHFLELMGFFPDLHGYYRAPVFNGHMHALLAFVRYALAANSTRFDRWIEAAIDTMRRRLPEQTFEDRFFSYMPLFPQLPDYGQKRAVQLAQGLLELAPGDDRLSHTVARLRALYETHIAPAEKEIVDAARQDARRIYIAARSQ